MSRETQISAVVSVETRDLLERHVRATGMKKGRLIESALRYHLQALEALPLDAVTQPRLVVTRRTGEEILSRIYSTVAPGGVSGPSTSSRDSPRPGRAPRRCSSRRARSSPRPRWA